MWWKVSFEWLACPSWRFVVLNRFNRSSALYEIVYTHRHACAALIVPGDAEATTPTDLNAYHN